jgi:UDP-GlcNAc:undecaprenyl-phosphate GlcNAc-1-phosphate transferase
MEFAVTGAAFLATLIGIYCLAPLTHKVGLTDKPDERKHHHGVIPLVGGIVIYAVMVCTALLVVQVTIELMYFLVAAGLVVFTGVLDDRFSISFKLRFIVQAIAALIIIYGVGDVLTSFGDIFGLGEMRLGYLSTPLTILGFLAVINAFNMLDGMDGLAGGISLVAFIGLYFATGSQVSDSSQLIISLFIGALLAYQMFNLDLFPKHLPKVFMGDAGSTLLGFVICAFLIRYSQNTKSIFSPVLALWLVAIPLMDMMSTFIRRLRHGKSPFYPDRTHIHHIFMRSGFTKSATLLIIMLSSCLLAIIGLILEQLQAPSWLSFGLFIFLGILYSLIIGRAWKLAKWIKRQTILNKFLLNK